MRIQKNNFKFTLLLHYLTFIFTSNIGTVTIQFCHTIQLITIEKINKFNFASLSDQLTKYIAIRGLSIRVLGVPK